MVMVLGGASLLAGDGEVTGNAGGRSVVEGCRRAEVAGYGWLALLLLCLLGAARGAWQRAR